MLGIGVEGSGIEFSNNPDLLISLDPQCGQCNDSRDAGLSLLANRTSEEDDCKTNYSSPHFTMQHIVSIVVQ